MSCAIELSIIIPSYNSSLYIKALLNSIQKQLPYGAEVIIIDDCSTDETLTIVKKEVVNDNRFSIIENEVNMGVCAARNIGLSHSRGNYVWFIDSDDKVNEDVIKKIILEIKDSCGDVYCYGHNVINELKGTRYRVPAPKNIEDNDDYTFSVLKKKSTFHLWNKIIRRDILNDVSFNEELSILEDMEFIIKLLWGNEVKFHSIDLDIYTYYLRTGSAVTTASYKKVEQQQIIFDFFLRYISSRNNDLFDSYLTRERINNCYQVFKSGYVLSIDPPSIIDVFSPKLSITERVKCMYLIIIYSKLFQR